MNQKPDIRRLLEFQKLLLSFSQIDRVVHRKHVDNFRLESDTEHSYNLAMTAWYLASYFPDLDMNLVIKLSLVHDLVEIHAGDTYVFASKEELGSKHEREKAALELLKKEWEDFSEMTDLIEGYEKRNSEEAKFVYALDKIMPMMQIFINDGKTWEAEKLSLDTLHNNKLNKVATSRKILPYYKELYDILLKSPNLFQD